MVDRLIDASFRAESQGLRLVFAGRDTFAIYLKYLGSKPQLQQTQLQEPQAQPQPQSQPIVESPVQEDSKINEVHFHESPNEEEEEDDETRDTGSFESGSENSEGHDGEIPKAVQESGFASTTAHRGVNQSGEQVLTTQEHN